MGYGSRFTSSNTGWWLLPVAGSARSTGIPELLTLLKFYLDHRFVPEGVILILTDLKGIGRASLYAFATAIALIGVNGEEPVT